MSVPIICDPSNERVKRSATPSRSLDNGDQFLDDDPDQPPFSKRKKTSYKVSALRPIYQANLSTGVPKCENIKKPNSTALPLADCGEFNEEATTREDDVSELDVQKFLSAALAVNFYSENDKVELVPSHRIDSAGDAAPAPPPDGPRSTTRSPMPSGSDAAIVRSTSLSVPSTENNVEECGDIVDKKVCPECQEEIPSTNKNLLVAHVRRHLAYAPFHCSSCDFQGHDAEEVRSHAASQHVDSTWRVTQKKKVDLEMKVREMMKKCSSAVLPMDIEKPQPKLTNASSTNLTSLLAHAEFDSSLTDASTVKKPPPSADDQSVSTVQLNCTACHQWMANDAETALHHVTSHVRFDGYRGCSACPTVKCVDSAALERHVSHAHGTDGVGFAVLLNDARRFRRDETSRLVEYFFVAQPTDQPTTPFPRLQCSLCDQRIALRPSSLLVHCRLHLNHAPYRCSRCETSSVDVAAAFRHFIAEHSTTAPIFAALHEDPSLQAAPVENSDEGRFIASYRLDADRERAVEGALNECFPGLCRGVEGAAVLATTALSTTCLSQNSSLEKRDADVTPIFPPYRPVSGTNTRVSYAPRHVDDRGSPSVTCSLCRVQVTRQRSSMSAHAKLHLAYKPLKCDYCPFRHFSVSRFRRHNARLHRGRPVKVTYEPVDDVQRQVDDMRRQCFGVAAPGVTSTGDLGYRGATHGPSSAAPFAASAGMKAFPLSTAPSTTTNASVEHRPVAANGQLNSATPQRPMINSSMNFSNMLRTLIKGQMTRTSPVESKTPSLTTPSGSHSGDNRPRAVPPSDLTLHSVSAKPVVLPRPRSSAYPTSIVMHGVQKRLCRLCNTYIANSSSAFENHASRHLNYKPYACIYCPYKSYVRGKVSRHVQQVHADMPLTITHLPKPDIKEKMRRVKLQCFPFLAGCQWQATTLIRDPRAAPNASSVRAAKKSSEPLHGSSPMNDHTCRSDAADDVTPLPVPLDDEEFAGPMGDDDDDDSADAKDEFDVTNDDDSVEKNDDVTATVCKKEVDDDVIGSSLVCALCADPVVDEEGVLKEHAMGHANKKTFRCPLCAWKGGSELEVQRHGRKVHGFTDFKVICSVEPALLTKIQNLCFPSLGLSASELLHSNFTQSQNSHQIPSGSSFRLQNSKSSNPPANPPAAAATADCNNLGYLNRIECRLCKFSVADNPKSVGIHIKNHLNYKPYRCPFCSYMSCEQSKARRHIENVHSTTGDAIIIEEVNDIKEKMADMKSRCFPHFGLYPNSATDSVGAEKPTNDVIVCVVCGEDLLKENAQSHAAQHVDAAMKCSYCPRAFTEVEEASMHKEAVHPLLRSSFEKLPENSEDSRRILLDLCFPGLDGPKMAACSPNWTGSVDSDEEPPRQLQQPQNPVQTQKPIFVQRLTPGHGFRPRLSRNKAVGNGFTSMEGRAPCRLCEQWISIHNNSLDVHVKNHLGYKPHSCPYCPYKSCIIGKVKRHLDSVHKSEPVKVNSFLKTSDLLKTLLFEARTLCFPADESMPVEPESLEQLHYKMENAKQDLDNELLRLSDQPTCSSSPNDPLFAVERSFVDGDDEILVLDAAVDINGDPTATRTPSTAAASSSFAAATLRELDFQNRFGDFIDRFVLSKRATDDDATSRDKFFDRCDGDDHQLATFLVPSRADAAAVGVKCKICAVEVDGVAVEAQEWHARAHLDYKPFHCDSCDFRSALEAQVKRHLLTAHGLPDAADRVVFNPVVHIDQKIAQTRVRCFPSIAGHGFQAAISPGSCHGHSSRSNTVSVSHHGSGAAISRSIGSSGMAHSTNNGHGSRLFVHHGSNYAKSAKSDGSGPRTAGHSNSVSRTAVNQSIKSGSASGAGVPCTSAMFNEDDDGSLEDLKRLHDVVANDEKNDLNLSLSFLNQSLKIAQETPTAGWSSAEGGCEIQCQICREAIGPDHLSKTKHMTKHVGDFEFRCHYCDYASFVQPETMRHAKSAHPDQPAKTTRLHVSSRSMSAAYERLAAQCFPAQSAQQHRKHPTEGTSSRTVDAASSRRRAASKCVTDDVVATIKSNGGKGGDVITMTINRRSGVDQSDVITTINKKKDADDDATAYSGKKDDDDVITSTNRSDDDDGDDNASGDLGGGWDRETDDGEENGDVGGDDEDGEDPEEGDDLSGDGEMLSDVAALRSIDGPRYVCRVCQTPVSTHSSSLYIHVKNHMNYKPYLCGYCDYRSPVKSKVRRHVITQHKDIRGSPLIEYAFKSNAQREIMRWKNKCFPEAIGSNFSSDRSSMTFDLGVTSSAPGGSALSVTLGDRTSCIFCKAFVADNPASKSVHAKNHLNSKPYRCAYCHYRSCLRGETRRHLVRQHPTLPVHIIFSEDEVACKADVDDMIDRCFVTGQLKPGHADTMSNNSLKKKVPKGVGSTTSVTPPPPSVQQKQHVEQPTRRSSAAPSKSAVEDDTKKKGDKERALATTTPHATTKRRVHDDHPASVCYNLRTTRSATKKMQEIENSQ